jgi:hypothetical protein
MAQKPLRPPQELKDHGFESPTACEFLFPCNNAASNKKQRKAQNLQTPFQSLAGLPDVIFLNQKS